MILFSSLVLRLFVFNNDLLLGDDFILVFLGYRRSQGLSIVHILLACRHHVVLESRVDHMDAVVAVKVGKVPLNFR